MVSSRSDAASAAAFKEQMASLQKRSAATLKLGPPAWLTHPHCTEGPLNADELHSFFHDGFLIKHGLFAPAELRPVMNDIEKQVDSLASTLLSAGLITDSAPSLGFYQRMAALEKQFPGASVLLHKTPALPPSFQSLWTDNRLLDIAQQLLGGRDIDVAGHPVWNLRVKVPQTDSSVVPWHQDAAYLDPESAHTLQVTAWIPFINATARNGCLQVIRGAHRTGKTAKHTCCAGGTWYVQMDMDDASSRLGVNCHDEGEWETCEVPLGSVLFLSNLIPHRSLANSSPDIRWSVDLRWQDANQPTGFWGIKDHVLMRRGSREGGKESEEEENFMVRWDEFLAVDRGKAQSKAAANATHVQEDEDGKEGGKEEVSAAVAAGADELKPVIAGPWMLRWEITNHNAHTAELEEVGAEGGEDAVPASWHKA
ncbi:phytanoyl dioxygenase domain-containing protein 1 homolog [Nannochloropsis oceanica]